MLDVVVVLTREVTHFLTKMFLLLLLVYYGLQAMIKTGY